MQKIVVCLVILTCVFSAAIPRAIAADPAAERLFTLRVLPLLKEKCFGCHGRDAEDIRGELDIRTLDGMLKGGESEEPCLIPGDPDASSMYQAILWNGSEMPPKENDRLTAKEADYFREWIASGAPWPNADRQKEIQREEWAVIENEDGVIVPTSGGTSEDWTYRRYKQDDIWAFKKVAKPAVPPGTSNPIDYFINQKITEAGLSPAGTAEPAQLIRRATLDLTGLPPTPREINTFVKAWKDDSQTAWDALVERLLGSKHYGERWAQHWLDVARYSDTSGFSNDYERSNAWRFRDYVIRSFNDDKPFNEFIVEQIAGDEYQPGNPETAIATGFLRMGPWGTAMIPQKEARQIYLDDLVHNVGQTFLSMPLRCCKCHDHKFDPIPTRDYYSMYAAFATTQPAEMEADFLASENQNGFAEKRKLVKDLLDYAKAELKTVNDKQEAAARKWYEEHGLPYKNVQARKNDPEDMKPPRHVGLSPEEQGIKKVREQDVWIWERRLERYEPLVQSVYNGPDRNVNARKLRKSGKAEREWRPSNFILSGGSLDALGDPVQPGVLSATALPVSFRNEPAADDESSPYAITTRQTGRRLILAQWIASDENPLTARSIVNRVWQYHFGTGLVETSNNFGAKGSKPTHPELLDWLAAEFVRGGWKIKPLHKLIMASDCYQRSHTPKDLEKQNEVDPSNRLLAVFSPRRLTAEELRDSMLKVTGELNSEMGGVPIMPEINMEVALQPRMIQFSIAPAHQPSRTPAERNRRSIYAYRVRGQPDPFLEVMNLPNPNESCELRDSASVSPQAFTLLNSDVMTDRSLAFAARVIREKGPAEANSKKWIRRAMQLAFGRMPSKTELESLQDYLNEMRGYHAEVEPEKVEYPTQVVRSLVEEFTGEPFEFIEKLNVFEDYVPDLKPWTADADTRALADVCMLLFNSNEFMFVY